VITSQGSVAFGYQTEAQAEAVHRAVLHALPVHIGGSYLCPHHPEGTVAQCAIDCRCRRPAPGAILHALERFGAAAEACLFVGDQYTDRQAGAAAGVPFSWAAGFFGWSHISWGPH
jgi:D-glycero-D-manno-heptose 1,7-bisphosphate phosphatase